VEGAFSGHTHRTAVVERRDWTAAAVITDSNVRAGPGGKLQRRGLLFEGNQKSHSSFSQPAMSYFRTQDFAKRRPFRASGMRR